MRGTSMDTANAILALLADRQREIESLRAELNEVRALLAQREPE